MRTSTLHLGGAARALEGLIDQHPQDLVLGLARHVADFVDEQRAAMGLFQRTGLARVFAIGLLDAEQFDFHALRRDRRGVDHDKRAVGAARGVMQRARGQFLARAGRADDQDAAVGLGRAIDGLAQLVHAGASGRSGCWRPAPAA